MDATVSADPLVGRLLDGRYLVGPRVGRGGFATVYRGTDTRLDRPVAIKVMQSGLADDPDFVARLAREAKAAARLNEPHVVAVHDQGVDGGDAFLVMEYVEGRTLADVLRERGRLEPEDAMAVLDAVLAALAAAHRVGLVHRDVKPDNVLVADDGAVKVADFGLARAAEAARITRTGITLGSVAYMAPETWTLDRSDQRSDVYAAGVLLWELLVGRPPHTGQTAVAVLQKHAHEDIPSPSTLVGVPRALDALVVRATRRDPDVRPQDAGEFLALLREARADRALDATQVLRRGAAPTLAVRRDLLAPADATAVVPGSAAGRERPPRRRRRTGVVLALVVAVLAGLVGAGGWWLGSGRWTEAPAVLDLAKAAAEQRLAERGLDVRYDDPAFDETRPPGAVVAQDPAPGERVRRDGSVTLTLSKGPQLFAVPPLGGTTPEEARRRLEGASLRVGAVTQDWRDDTRAGLVFRSDPLPGVQLRRGTAVALVVSRGPRPVPVPSVVGRPLAEAVGALKEGRLAATTTEAFDETVPKGVVVSQDPAEGQLVPGSRVALVVSRGPELVAVPDVDGRPVAEARATLEAAGFRVRVRSIPGPGIVRSQDPDGGTRVRKGTTVTLNVF